MRIFDLVENNKDKHIDLYCDMDGVLTEYGINNFDYNTIRPIKTSINNLKKLSEYDNVTVYILSICKTNDIINDKINWLEKYAPFLNKDNIILLSKEVILNKESRIIKKEYLQEHIIKDNITILIEDDIGIIKEVYNNIDDINIFHVSSLID